MTDIKKDQKEDLGQRRNFKLTIETQKLDLRASTLRPNKKSQSLSPDILQIARKSPLKGA